MVCKMCATGADMQVRANELPPGADYKKRLRKIGIAIHGYCNGCDCAHQEVK